MSQDVFKAPKAKRKHGSHGKSNSQAWSPNKKKKRTREDFFAFCNIVLEYTNYEAMKQEELRTKNNTSPLDSGGSTAESFTSESTTSSTFSEAETEDMRPTGLKSPESVSSMSSDNDLSYISPKNYEDDSFDLVTCFCSKPFAGRPMIECCECYTWIHLSCAKIRKSNIPEEFICQKCRESKFTTRKSQRVRLEKKLMNA